MAYEWDPNKVHSNNTLSNSNRTLTLDVAGTAYSAISDWSKSSGKWYWEIVLNYSTNRQYQSFGVCNQDTGTDYTENIRAGWNESWAGMFNTRKYHDGSYSLGGFSTIANGDVLQFALDVDNGRLYLGENGTWYNSADPATNTNPHFEDSTMILAVSACATLRYATDQATSCFKASELTYTPPTGYSALDSDAGTTHEPDVSSQGLGLSESVDGHASVKNIAATGNLGFSETIGVNIEKIAGIDAGIGFDDAPGVDHLTGLERDATGNLGFSETIGLIVERHRGVDAGIGFDDVSGLITETETGIEAGLGFSEEIGLSVELARGIVEGFGFSESAGALNFSQWVRENIDRAVYTYHLMITGTANGLPDYEVPGFRSLQFTRREEAYSHLSCVLAYDADVLAAIIARSDGELVVDMAATVNGLESLRETIIQADYESVRYDRGGNSQSITLTGVSQEANASKRVSLAAVTGESMMQDGRIKYRCARPDFYLNPGDIAVYNGQEITVGYMLAIISTTTHYMDVSE